MSPKKTEENTLNVNISIKQYLEKNNVELREKKTQNVNLKVGNGN